MFLWKSKMIRILVWCMILAFCAVLFPNAYGVEVKSKVSTGIVNSGDGLIECEFSYFPSCVGITGARLRITNRSKRDRTITVIGNIGYYQSDGFRQSILVPAGKTIMESVYLPYLPYYYTTQAMYLLLPERVMVYSSNNNRLEHEHLIIFRPDQVKLFDSISARELAGVLVIDLTEKQWNELKPDRREMLLDWCSAGGTLHITLPSHRQSAFREQNKLHPFARGRLQLTDHPLDDSTAYNTNLTAQSPGVALNNRLYYRLENSTNQNPIRWKDASTSRIIMIPLVILVGILLGPGIFFFCKRKKIPGMALILIPLCSLVGCVAVLAFALLSDGITPNMRFRSISFLDQETGKHMTHSFIGIDAPIGLMEALALSDDSIVTCVQSASSSIEKRNGKLIMNEYIRPRIPSFLSVTRSAKTRARLDVKSTHDGMTVVNGLGAGIHELYLRDQKGKLWKSDKRIEAGAEARLQPASNSIAFYTDHGQIYYGDQQLFYPGRLPDNAYQAHMDDAPFAEMTLKNVRKEAESDHYVIGKL